MIAPAERPQLLLWGFMGAGKSTTGRSLATRRQVDFVDLDRLIEEREGATVAAIFAARGEATFRALEAEHLTRLLDTAAPRVVALGGGTLLDRRLRARALAEAFVVLLDVDHATALSRVARSDRPLLARSPEKAARRLFAARASAYREAHLIVDARGDHSVVIAAVDAVWKHHR